MVTKLDILTNGEIIIYKDNENGTITEPCFFSVMQIDEKKFQPNFRRILTFTDSETVDKHNASLVLYSVIPSAAVHNAYIDLLDKIRVAKTGIVVPNKNIQLVNK